jgi:putative colanic acid biosynthesis acetyltransferase WcaB
MQYLFQDWKRNSNNFKGKIILFLFRLASIANRHKILFILFIPYLIFYRIFVEWVLGVELPYKTKVGRGFTIYHGQSLVINDNSIFGENCTIRHCVTVGNKLLSDGGYSKSPIIGSNVDIGSNVCIIGPILIGDNVSIGVGSVVVKDIPSNCVVVGNPSRIIRYK